VRLLACVRVRVLYVHSKSYILHSTPNAISDTPYHMHSDSFLLIALCDVICRGDCTLLVAAPSLSEKEQVWRPLSKRICRPKRKEIKRNGIELRNEKHHSYHCMSIFKIVMISTTV
jgi:hypothetical protein